MLKRLFICFFVFVLVGLTSSKVFSENQKGQKDLVISNEYFSFKIPENIIGTYTTEKFSNGIFISEKESVKAGLGGFAFGLQIFKEPEEYAKLADHKKIGELTDKKGTVYDLVLIKPTEIYFGDGEKIRENYTRLYDFAENVEISGVNGGKYYKNRGMRGEELYGEVLKKHIQAINNNWGYNQYQNAGISILYSATAKNSDKALKKVGYAYYDINSDGIDELFIGEISKGKKISPIFDIYTIVDRKPVHVASSSKTDKYFVCDDSYLCRELLVSHNKNTFVVNFINGNSSKLNRQVEYMYNSDLDKNNPWLRAFGITDNYENISKEMFTQGKNYFNEYKKFNYIPLSEIK